MAHHAPMKIHAHLASLVLVLFASLTLSACGGEGVVALEIGGNDAMQFDKTSLEVPAGSTVRLTLWHTGKMSAELMGHNWVLLAQGADVTAFATAAIDAKDSDFIPADMADMVLAHTGVLGGGESQTIEFAAPPAGTYTFLCSFPGHFGMMQGQLVVTP